MEGNKVDNGEFAFKGDNQKFQQDLIKSFQLDFKNYYVGVPCPCCQPKERCDWMKESTYLPDHKLTWANIFVNGNFEYFNKEFVKDFSLYKDICFIGRGNIDNLPFTPTKHFKTTTNSHINNVGLIDLIPSYIEENNISNGLFIISAGPFANILCSILYPKYPNNTFIDIGSVFDVSQGLGATRGYLQNSSNINKICIW